MVELKNLVESYQPTTYKRVKRSEQTHLESKQLAEKEITRLLSLYQQQQTLQEKRLVRDAIDRWLRRYHGYAIKENIGAHYYETGLPHGAKTEFEHVIPASVARDLLLFDRLTIDEALNIPTCRLSAAKHKKLNSTK